MGAVLIRPPCQEPVSLQPANNLVLIRKILAGSLFALQSSESCRNSDGKDKAPIEPTQGYPLLAAQKQAVSPSSLGAFFPRYLSRSRQRGIFEIAYFFSWPPRLQ